MKWLAQKDHIMCMCTAHTLIAVKVIKGHRRALLFPYAQHDRNARATVVCVHATGDDMQTFQYSACPKGKKTQGIQKRRKTTKAS